jgi:hypothetical protein
MRIRSEKPLSVSSRPQTASAEENQNIGREPERIAIEAHTLEICSKTSAAAGAILRMSASACATVAVSATTFGDMSRPADSFRVVEELLHQVEDRLGLLAGQLLDDVGRPDGVEDLGDLRLLERLDEVEQRLVVQFG